MYIDDAFREMKITCEEFYKGKISKENALDISKKHLQIADNKSELITFLENMGLKYTFTVTFNQYINRYEAMNQMSTILRMVRKKYFPNNLRKEYFKGFVCEEKQVNGNIHFHGAICDHYIFNKKPEKNFPGIFKEVCTKIKRKKFENGENRYCGSPTIDVERGVVVGDYYKGKWAEYCTKRWKGDLNTDFIHFIGYDGIPTL